MSNLTGSDLTAGSINTRRCQERTDTPASTDNNHKHTIFKLSSTQTRRSSNMSVYDDLETVWDSVEVPGVSCLMTLSSQVFLSHVPTPQLSPGHAWPSWRQTYCHSYHQLHNSECQVLHMKIVKTLFEKGNLRCKPNHRWLKQPPPLIMDWNLVEPTKVIPF